MNLGFPYPASYEYLIIKSPARQYLTMKSPAKQSVNNGNLPEIKSVHRRKDVSPEVEA